jgi:hypothetical protein
MMTFEFPSFYHTLMWTRVAGTIIITMMMRSRHALIIAAIAAVVVLLGLAAVVLAKDQTSTSCKPASDAFCFAPQIESQLEPIGSVAVPKIATPGWLAAQSTPATREVTYTVQTKGTVTADLNEFKAQVAETLTSPLGWSRLGVRFTQVDSGGQFTVWLSQDSQMTTFSATGCDATVSCTVGDNVIINQTRWLNGSDAWNSAGGGLRDYRHMVVNHETGHWLGHGHEFCSGAGQPAPVMQQQTINMQGCKPNPWPLANEMYAPKLGIRS